MIKFVRPSRDTCLAEATVVYHRLLASTLEDVGCMDYEWLSVHFEASGNREKASRYTALAAKNAVEGLAFDRAARLYRRIIDLGGQDKASTPLCP